MDMASCAFQFEELRMEERLIECFPHLLGLAPEIRETILRYLLDIDCCRYESEHQD